MSLFLELDGRDTLQSQLVRALAGAIAEGSLAAGTRLPSSRDLALALGIGRNTVALALDELIARGLVASRPRAGVYVNARPARAAVRTRPGAAAAPSLSRAAVALLAEPPAPQQDGPRRRFDLAYGEPLVSPALIAAWRKALAAVSARAATGYPAVQGLPALRSELAAMLRRSRGLEVAAEDILIVAGSQQAYDLCAAALVDPGDGVALEDPHYEGIRRAFVAAGARLHPCPVDAEGIVVDALPATGVKLACVTPSHQFPTAALLSTARRQALLDWSHRTGAWIVEDDYDGEFRYGHAPAPALHAMDGAGRVIYVGTFSKLLFPSLRLGYVIAPPALRAPMLALKQTRDFGCSTLEQHAVAELLRNGTVQRHLNRSGRELMRRRAALVAALQAHGAGRVVVEGINAGMHIVARIDGLSWRAWNRLSGLADRAGLRLLPVRPHWLPARDPVRVLLGFSSAAPKAAAEAGRRLCAVIDALEGEHD